MIWKTIKHSVLFGVLAGTFLVTWELMQVKEQSWDSQQVISMNRSKISTIDHLSRDEKRRTNAQDNVKDTMEIEISLSPSYVLVKKDNTEIYRMANKTHPWGEGIARLHAGVHLLVFNQRSGRLMRASNFYTWQPEIDLQLAQAMKDVMRGRIVALIGAPEFTEYLRKEVQDQIESFGSNFSKGFTVYDTWCWLGWKGGRVLQEGLTTANYHNAFHNVSHLHVHAEIPLLKDDEESCGWYDSYGMKERASFCEKYDGYGDFCSCQDPVPWSPLPHMPSNTSNASIPVAIVTAKRLWKVLRQVGQIRASPGGDNTDITIFVDGYNEEARDLGRVLDLPIVEHHNEAPVGSTQRINNHVKFSLQQIFERHPQAALAIILEDDLELAPDFIPFFQQAAPLLLKDETILFINAFNYNSYSHTAHDPTKLYRANGIPGYGWMTSRWASKDMLLNWAPANKKDATWDWWLRYRLMESKAMIIPEVPRTRHMGAGGVHISGFDQILFTAQPLNNESYVNIDIDSAKKDVYDTNLSQSLRNAKIAVIRKHPCDTTPLPTKKTGDSYIIYIHQPTEGREDHSYYVISLCLGINDRDPHESYNMMSSFPFYGNQVYLIYCPNSPYCQPRKPQFIYKATEDDANYAKDNAFPRGSLRMNYAYRIPAKSDEEQFALQNRHVFNYLVS